jgi:hypothetical protein
VGVLSWLEVWLLAKVITFLPKAVYIGGGNSSVATLSEIFEITEERNLEVELRVYAAQPYTLSITGSLETTSDPTFLDASWKTVSGTFTQAGIGNARISLAGSTVLSFVRARLEVPQDGVTCALLTAVAREA